MAACDPWSRVFIWAPAPLEAKDTSISPPGLYREHVGGISNCQKLHGSPFARLGTAALIAGTILCYDMFVAQHGGGTWACQNK